MCMLIVDIGRSLLIFSDITSKMTAWQPCFFVCYRTRTLVWLWISTPNFSSTILVYMRRTLLIFSDVTFKMAAWWPYRLFGYHTLTFVRLWISTPNCSSSAMLVWLWILIPNVSSTLFVSVGRNLLILSYIQLWPPVAHYCPSPASGGIPVGHWPMISSYQTGLYCMLFSAHDTMKTFWHSNSTEIGCSSKAMMLDKDFEDLGRREIPEILALLPDIRGKVILELGAGIGWVNIFVSPLTSCCYCRR